MSLLFSANAIAYALSQLAVQSDVFLPAELLKNFKKLNLLEEQLSYLTKNDLESLIVTLDNFPAQIKNLRWRTKDNRVEIYVDAEGDFDKKVYVGLKEGNYDQAIFMGSDPKQGEMQLPARFHGLLTEDAFSIELNPLASKTITEQAYDLLISQGFKINAKISTLLLASLYWETDSFKLLSSAKIFQLANKLIQLGAKSRKAALMAYHNLTLSHSQLISYIHSKVKVKNEIAYTVLEQNTVVEQAVKSFFMVNKVPIADLEECKVAFVILNSAGRNIVFIKSNSKDLNLQEVKDKYQAEGGKYYLEFISEKGLNQLTDDLLYDLEKSLINQPAKSTVSDNLDIDKAQMAEITTNDPLAPANEPMHSSEQDTAKNEESAGPLPPANY